MTSEDLPTSWPPCPRCGELELFCPELHAHTLDCPLKCYRCSRTLYVLTARAILSRRPCACVGCPRTLPADWPADRKLCAPGCESRHCTHPVPGVEVVSGGHGGPGVARPVQPADPWADDESFEFEFTTRDPSHIHLPWWCEQFLAAIRWNIAAERAQRGPASTLVILDDITVPPTTIQFRDPRTGEVLGEVVNVAEPKPEDPPTDK